jgi:hypothetical protein
VRSRSRVEPHSERIGSLEADRPTPTREPTGGARQRYAPGMYRMGTFDRMTRRVAPTVVPARSIITNQSPLIVFFARPAADTGRPAWSAHGPQQRRNRQLVDCVRVVRGERTYEADMPRQPVRIDVDRREAAAEPTTPAGTSEPARAARRGRSGRPGDRGRATRHRARTACRTCAPTGRAGSRAPRPPAGRAGRSGRATTRPRATTIRSAGAAATPRSATATAADPAAATAAGAVVVSMVLVGRGQDFFGPDEPWRVARADTMRR